MSEHIDIINRQLKNIKYSEKALEVYEIIKHYFGEEFVDIVPSINSIMYLLNNPSDVANDDTILEDITHENINDCGIIYNSDIIIYYPTCVITNENYKSHLMRDLFIKIRIDEYGKLLNDFKIIRSTYTDLEYLSGYCHSHRCSINDDTIFDWRDTCLGNGPIRRTELSLFNEFDNITWMLFCRELDLYIHTESLKGIPYIYIKDIHKSSNYITNYTEYDINYSTEHDINYSTINVIGKVLWNKYINHYINNFIKSIPTIFTESTVTLGLTIEDFAIKFSNDLIEFLYQHKDECDFENCIISLFKKKIYKNGKLYGLQNGDVRYNTIVNKNVTYFKNNIFKLNILTENEENNNLFYILDKNVVAYMYYITYVTINSYKLNIKNENESIPIQIF